MRFVRFQRFRRIGLGVLDSDGLIIDLSAAAATLLIEEGDDPAAEQEAALRIPVAFSNFLAGGQRSLELADAAVDFARRRGPSGGIGGEPLSYQRSEVRLLPTVNPPLVIAPGAAFRDSKERGGSERKQHREMFLRNPYSILGPDDEIPLQSWLGEAVDAKPRLGVVIGSSLRCAEPGEIASAIFGFCPLIDLCIRDQYALSWAGALFHVQYPHARSADGTLVAGPVVSRDMVGNPANLKTSLLLDGTTAYAGHTPANWSEVETWISTLSRSVTLDPGALLIPGDDEDGTVRPTAKTGRAELVYPPPVSPTLSDGMRVEIRIQGVGEIHASALRCNSSGYAS